MGVQGRQEMEKCRGISLLPPEKIKRLGLGKQFY